MEIKATEENLIVEIRGREYTFARGSLMLSHCDLNYLKIGDSRIILFRYTPRELSKRNALLSTNHLSSLKTKTQNAVNNAKNAIRKKTENSMMFPCPKLSKIPYDAVTKNLLRRSLLLQEEISRDIAVIPCFKSPNSLKRFCRSFREVEQMFSDILHDTEKLRGAFLPSKLLRDSDCLTILRQSELDFLFLNAWGSWNLESFYRSLYGLLELEKPVFVTDAALFVKNELFAPRLAHTGIAGYSLRFVDSPILLEPTYYDISNGVPKRQKDHRTMVLQYGSEDFPLSEICNCSVCEKNTIRTFFSGEDLEPWEKNRLHKLEFAETASSEGVSGSEAKATIP